MAVTKEQMDKDAADFAAGYAEELTRAEPTEDEAFGLTPPAAEELPDGDGAAGADAAVAVSDAEPVAAEAPPAEVVDATGEEVVGAEAAEVAAAEAPAADAAPAGDDIERERQRLRSWEGRLKAMEAELQAKAAAPAATPEADDGAAGDDGVDAGAAMSADDAIRTLSEDFGPDFVAMIRTIAAGEASKAAASLADEKIGALGKTVEDVIADIQDDRARRHFETIRDAHPDFADLAGSPALVAWVDALPESDRADTQRVIESGTAREIVRMLAAFKASQQQADNEDADAWDAAEGVRSSGLKLPEPPKASADYAAAFDEF